MHRRYDTQSVYVCCEISRSTPMTIILGAVTETMQPRRQMAIGYCQSKATSRHPIAKHKQPSNIPNTLDTIQIFPNQLSRGVLLHGLDGFSHGG